MAEAFVLGWEEWLALPDLGLPALKCKIDTGARTAALHAVAVEPFGPAEAPQVRFGVHPVPGRKDIQIVCTAPVADRREYVSSNGESEWRYVISTHARMGERTWPLEVSLTNRESMAYRMLLGRQSIPDDGLVQPHRSFRQPQLDYTAYEAGVALRRAVRIALLTREPNNYSCRRLVEAAGQRGIEVKPVDTGRCSLMLSSTSRILDFAGEPAETFDAVIPRIGPSMTSHGVAVVRQFETLGRYVLNRAGAIATARDKLRAHQVLARHGLAMPRTAIAYSAQDARKAVELVGGPPVVIKLTASSQGKGVVLAESMAAAESVISAFRDLDATVLVQEFVREAEGTDLRCIVLGGKVVATMQRQAAAGEFRSNLHLGGSATKVRLSLAERKLAQRAATAIGLDFAGVDMLRSATGPVVLEVNGSPGLEGIEGVSTRDLAGDVIDYIAERAAARLLAP